MEKPSTNCQAFHLFADFICHFRSAMPDKMFVPMFTPKRVQKFAKILFGRYWLALVIGYGGLSIW